MVAYFAGNTGDWDKYHRAMDKIDRLHKAGRVSEMDHNSFLALQRKEQDN